MSRAWAWGCVCVVLSEVNNRFKIRIKTAPMCSIARVQNDTVGLNMNQSQTFDCESKSRFGFDSRLTVTLLSTSPSGSLRAASFWSKTDDPSCADGMGSPGSLYSAGSRI